VYDGDVSARDYNNLTLVIIVTVNIFYCIMIIILT